MIEVFFLLVLVLLTTVFLDKGMIFVPLRTELPAELLVLLTQLHHFSAISLGGRRCSVAQVSDDVIKFQHPLLEQMVFLRELLEFLSYLQVLSTKVNVLLFKLSALEVGETRSLAANTHDVILGQRHGESLILYLLFVEQHLLVELQALLSDLSHLLLQLFKLPVMLRF